MFKSFQDAMKAARAKRGQTGEHFAVWSEIDADSFTIRQDVAGQYSATHVKVWSTSGVTFE